MKGEKGKCVENKVAWRERPEKQRRLSQKQCGRGRTSILRVAEAQEAERRRGELEWKGTHRSRGRACPRTWRRRWRSRGRWGRSPPPPSARQDTSRSDDSDWPTLAEKSVNRVQFENTDQDGHPVVVEGGSGNLHCFDSPGEKEEGENPCVGEEEGECTATELHDSVSSDNSCTRSQERSYQRLPRWGVSPETAGSRSLYPERPPCDGTCFIQIMSK